MPLYLALFDRALSLVVAGLTPIILLLLAVTLVTTLIQATFQIEDMALGLLVRLVALLATVASGGFAALTGLRQLTQDWLWHLGPLVHQSWS
ncbi:flagellar biosynthetic protein FliQ [Acidisoma sp. C75]